MPDFEALIRHQQLKGPQANKRLKVVENSISNKSSKDEFPKVNSPKIFHYFLAGFAGSLIGTVTLFFLIENNLITLNISKIQELLKLYIRY